MPVDAGLVICFDEMRAILRVDLENHVAVAQPGVTLRELDERLRGTGLHYPVFPGELSGSLGGTVATNAGGMRAVRHGVTRHHVLGLEAVLVDGTVIRTGGAFVKSSSGYDLTQLLVGSEGTLALVTEVTVKLSPALPHAVTLLVPFAELAAIGAAVPVLVASGLAPSILEYVDEGVMRVLAQSVDAPLGVAADVADAAGAYLIVVLETRTADQREADLAEAAGLLSAAGALEVYVLEGATAAKLIEARERAFWKAKEVGANEIVDVVVPRASVTAYLGEVTELAASFGAYVSLCGHVGDGNVHLSVFLPDEARREEFLLTLFRRGLDLGGAVSGEHGLGKDKRAPYLELTDPVLVELQRSIKRVFDPRGLLNPYRHLDPRDDEVATNG